jgi:hypothetical protein
MENQYAFINPGEKLYVLLSDVGRDEDYVHVVEITFPTVEYRGKRVHDPDSTLSTTYSDCTTA